MESVWSPLESTSSTFGGVLSARRTPEARSVPKRSVELTLMCMIVNYTPPDLLAVRMLILVRFQDETNDPGPSGQTSQRLGICRHPREASFKLTDDCLH